MQYLNTEISKLHFPDRVFGTVYVLILEQLLMPKILYFGACHKRPLFRSFTNTFLMISFLEVGYPILWNIYECNTKSYLRRCILLCYVMHVFLLWFSFQRSFLFVFSHMFWYTLKFIRTDCILKHKWCIEKDEASRAVYLLKVSNRDTTGIIESCWKWNFMMLFLCPYW